MDRQWIFGLLLAAVATASQAAPTQPMGEVVSPVFKARGDVAALTRKASGCIARIVRPGFTTAPTILSSDPVAGEVVANNQFEYVDKTLFATVERARSKLTFQAKDGRFRLTHTDVEVFFMDREWRAAREFVGKPSPERAAMDAISAKVAACVQAPEGDTW